MTKENVIALSTSFYANAQLKSNMIEVKQKLNEFKHARLLNDGPILKYEISKLDQNKQTFILELTDEHISLRFFFKKQDYAIYKDGLLTFISLIAFLGDLYEAKLDSIYEYIVEALGRDWQHTVKRQDQVVEGLKERIKVLNESNCRLSHQLIAMLYENKRLSADSSLYKEFSKSVVDSIKEESNISEKDYVALTRLGVDLSLIKKVESNFIKNRLGSP